MAGISKKKIKYKNGKEVMTKEIIIDGVDVSECPYYKRLRDVKFDEDCRLGWKIVEFAQYCNRNVDCFYKLLKRKEQECALKTKQLEVAREGLNSIINTDTGECGCAYLARKALQQIEEMKVNRCVTDIVSCDF